MQHRKEAVDHWTFDAPKIPGIYDVFVLTVVGPKKRRLGTGLVVWDPGKVRMMSRGVRQVDEIKGQDEVSTEQSFAWTLEKETFFAT
jgi:hypothetical protein